MADVSYACCLLCMPAVAEESGLLASDIGPRRRPIFCLRALFAVAGELMLGTIRHCGRSGILASHFTFVPRLIRLITRATLYIYRGRGFGFFIVVLRPICRYPRHAVDPTNLVELRVCTRVQVSVGSSTVVASSAAHHCQVGSLPPCLVLFKVFIG